MIAVHVMLCAVPESTYIAGKHDFVYALFKTIFTANCYL